MLVKIQANNFICQHTISPTYILPTSRRSFRQHERIYFCQHQHYLVCPLALGIQLLAFDKCRFTGWSNNGIVLELLTIFTIQDTVDKFRWAWSDVCQVEIIVIY